MNSGGRRGTLGIRIIGLLVSVVALWVAVRSVDVGATATQLSRANAIPLLLCLAVISTQVLLRSFRWRVLLPAPRNGGRIALERIVPVLLVGYLGNAVLPARLGEPIRAYMVARREDLDAVEAFGSVVLERVVDTASLAVIACIAAVGVGAPEWIVRATGIVAVVGCVGTAVLALVGLGALVRVARRLVGRTPFATTLEPILSRLDAFAIGIDRPSRSTDILLAAIVSAGCWLLDGTTFWLVATSLGISVSPAAALLVAAVTVLGTALPSAPGYVGTFELAAAATAQALGVAASPALAMAVLAHAMAVLPTAAAGAISLVAINARLGRLAKDAAEAERTPASPAVGQP